MPSLFKQSSIAVLEERKAQVNREIASLETFRDKIDRRITHLRSRSADRTKPAGAICGHCGRPLWSEDDHAPDCRMAETEEQRHVRYVEAARQGIDIGPDPHFMARLERGEHLNDDRFLRGVQDDL